MTKRKAKRKIPQKKEVVPKKNNSELSRKVFNARMDAFLANCEPDFATIHNERVKLRATWMNNASIALLGAGLFATFVRRAIEASKTDGFWSIWYAIIAMKTVDWTVIGLCVLVIVVLHYSGVASLRGLRKTPAVAAKTPDVLKTEKVK